MGFDGYDAERAAGTEESPYDPSADTTTSANAADAIDIAAGFIVDDAGNAATTDVSDATSITYTETSTDGDPSIVKLYSTSDDVDDSDDATEDSVATAYGLGATFNVTAEMSETVLAGSSVSVAFGTGTSVVLTAAQNGTLMTGTYTVVAGQTTADLAVTGVTVESPAYDVYGNAASDLTAPTGATTGFSNIEDIEIDSTAPTATITGVTYDVDNGVFTISGTLFNTIDRPTDNDIVDQLDWSKFVWDVDNNGDGSPDITFDADDFDSAIITGNELEASVKAGKLSEIQGWNGYGYDGYEESANAADAIDIASGFFKDDAGNVSTYSKDAQSITYSDVGRPTITSFGTAQVADDGSPEMDGDGNPVVQPTGSYKAGDSMYIFANMSENVLGGSAITVNLSSGASVRLVAQDNQDYLIGQYTITSGNSELTALEVSSMSLTAADDSVDSILDYFGNQLNDTALPATNIDDGSIIKVDNVPVVAASATIDGAGGTEAAEIDEGDVIALTFSEAVGNTSDLASQITTIFGAAAVSNWSDPANTLSITLGDDETLSDGDQIALNGVEDAAGNSSDLTFTLDIA